MAGGGGAAGGSYHYHNVVHYHGLALWIQEPILVAPLSPSPSFPFIVECSPPRPPALTQLLLAQPWYGHGDTEEGSGYGRDTSADPCPAPPPTLASDVPSSPAFPPKAEPPPAKRRRPRVPAAPKRAGVRLAAQAVDEFIPVADMAMRHKVLKESLVGCSASLCKHVKGRKLLKKKHPLGALHLNRLDKAVGFLCVSHHAVAVSTAATSAP